MPLRSHLRVSAFWYLTPLALALGGWFISEVHSFVPGYRVADTAAAMLSLVLVAPLIAAGSAWQTARLRRGRVLARGAVRSTHGIVFSACWPVLLAGLIPLTTFFVICTGSYPTPEIAVVGIVILLGHGMIGAWLGTVLRAVLAVPLAAILSYCWLTMAGGIGPLSFSKLGGALTDCCAIAETYSHRALMGTGLVAAGFLLAGVVALMIRPWPAASALAWSAVIIVAIASGAALIPPTNNQRSVQPRADAQVCRSTPVRLCVWPEYTSSFPELERVASDMNTHWARYGLATPTAFAEDHPTSELEFHYRPGQSENLLRMALTRGYIAGFGCHEPDPLTVRQQAFRTSVAQQASIWLMLANAIPRSFLTDNLLTSRGNWKVVNQILTRPVADQIRWIHGRLHALATCTVSK